MPFQRFGGDAIDFNRELLYLGEVDLQSIDQGGEDQSFALHAAGKVLNRFAMEIDRSRRSLDPG